ncbi:MAG: beta-propeller fold lactonase family protein [Chthoniobacterales bacterium]
MNLTYPYFMKPKQFVLTGAIVAALATFGASVAVFGVSKAGAASPRLAQGSEDTNISNRVVGAVYAMTNALTTNQIQVFRRRIDGTLIASQTINTGGGGSGFQRQGIDSLTSQGGLILDRSHRHLFAVNTETLQADPTGDLHDCQMGTISSFLVGTDGSLTLVGKVSSGGLFPDSLAVNGNQLYVLNAGGPGSDPACGIGPNITGFTVSPDGHLTPIVGSTQPIDPGSEPGSFLSCDPGGFPSPEFDCGLNPPAFPRSPAQVGFTPDGDFLIVTIKSTNTIYVFPRDDDGKPLTPAIHQASGPNQPTYFGFSFDKQGNLLVAEAFGASPTIPAADAGSVSSFAIGRRTGTLTPISASIPNGQTTPCWAVVDPVTVRHLYVSNNNSNSISSYTIGNDGSLTLLDMAAGIGNGPNDMAIVADKTSRKGRVFLYSNNSLDGTVGAWVVNPDGSLTLIGTYGTLPANDGAQGLAAY